MNRLMVVSVVLAVLAAVPGNAKADAVGIYLQHQDGLRAAERFVPAGSEPVEFALSALAAGPSPQEQAVGLFSALPPGTEIIAVDVQDGRVTVDFSADLLAEGLDDHRIEEIFEQVTWTLHSAGHDGSVSLTVHQQPLWSYLPPAAKIEPGPALPEIDEALPMQAAGTALAGKKISLSPGHGLVWLGSYWAYERPQTCAPLNREDLHNTELMQYLQIYLLQDGATVKDYRCLDKSFGNHATGNPWWYMSGSYWLQLRGYPCSVYANATGHCTLGSGASETSDSIRSRPLASDYDNTDAHVSMHTNALAGDCFGSGCPNGTCTYYDASSSHAAWATVSRNLAQAVNNNIISTIRTHYPDATWRDRGALDADGRFAETRMPDRAAILIELAFHDSCDRDALYLRDNFFRSATMWGVYKGLCDYFGVSPTYGFYASEYVSDTIPSTMNPGQSYNVSLTLRNRGVLWTSVQAFRLGAVGDSDPFTANLRVNVSGEVNTGQTYTFNFTMTAPTTPGTYTTDWRMLRELVTWFGATFSKQIQVGSGNPQAPSITQHPANASVAAGGTASFTVVSGGSTPLAYQWQKNGANLSNGGRVSGATAATLQIASVETADQGSYRCVVTNAHGSATSNAATLAVTANLFIVESRTGGQNFAKYSETGVWADVTGKSSAAGTTGGIGSRYGSTYYSAAGEKHALFKANLPATGMYEVFATWAASGNRRSPIRHQVTHADGTAGVNVDQTATANEWVSLGTFRFLAGTDTGQVDVNNTIIDVSGSMYADAIKWEWRGSGVAAPSITQHPAARNICPGTNTTFTVAATGQGTLTYQWRKGAANLANGGHYSGVTTATLTVTGADAGDLGSYLCVVSNTGGSTNSNQAALTLKAATAVTAQPLPASVLVGGGTSFSVAATGDGALTYRWQREQVNLADGGHYAGTGTATLIISNADQADAGNYRCVVTAGCGTATSNEAALTVTTPPRAMADFDGDEDVDLDDFGHLQACLTGLGIAVTDPQCLNADLDGSGYIDNTDLFKFMLCVSGADIPADVYCGE